MFETRLLRRASIALAATASAMALTGCASSQPADATFNLDASAESRYLFGNLAAYMESVKFLETATTFAEYLPSQPIQLGKGAAVAASELVVQGRIAEVEGARGYFVPGGPDADADSGTEAAFDDPRATWRVASVTVDVGDGVGQESMPKQLRFGVVVDGPDTDALLTGLRDLDEVVVVLDGQGFFTFDPDLYNISRFGSLLGAIDENGTIGFPAIEPAEQAEFVGDLTTWSKVEKEYELEKEPISVEMPAAE
ncbi:hypothetical protein [Mumia sp. Pv 4-285]|uniref:hypothetical protein n=1 Tax=Mumia qirimensis TaxID=3234852 RepID=UPI00351D51D2